jgi:capsular polysaccharide biosynthesis protein
MERQESLSFIEVSLQLLNNNLKHFKLFLALLLLPTLFAFVLVMWVIKPAYSATAVVTPPSSS